MRHIRERSRLRLPAVSGCLLRQVRGRRELLNRKVSRYGGKIINSNPPYAIWSIWKYLHIWQRTFLIVLCIFVVYCLISCLSTIIRLHAIQNANDDQIASIRSALKRFQKRLYRQRQFALAAFFLFGVVLFRGLQQDYLVLDSGRASVGGLILENFVISFAYATNVFWIFLLIHCMHWVASSDVETCALSLDAQSLV